MTSSTKRFVSGHRFSDAESHNENAPSGAAYSATNLGGLTGQQIRWDLIRTPPPTPYMPVY
jgi:hypothetical protein